MGKKDINIPAQVLADMVRESMEKDSPFRIQATGSSMSPMIRGGDIIVISPLLGKEPEVGDVVAYKSPALGTALVHRVVRKEGEYLYILGDNPPGNLEIVRSSSLLGHVVSIERKGKNVRFGLGPGKKAIALCTRSRLFQVLAELLKKVVRITRRRNKNG